MMSCPVFGATRVWRHLVMESLPDPPLSAGFHHSAPTYVGAENAKAALSGLARAAGITGAAEWWEK